MTIMQLKPPPWFVAMQFVGAALSIIVAGFACGWALAVVVR